MAQGSLLGIRRIRSRGPFIENEPSEEELTEFMQEHDLEGLPLDQNEAQALMQIETDMLMNWLTGEVENFHNRAYNEEDLADTIELREVIMSESAGNYASGIGAFDELQEARYQI
jgi:predicted house-cleaning noncanonical NTP pyrophosphatase (MazG superfamily)